jgi:hypothetical protein
MFRTESIDNVLAEHVWVLHSVRFGLNSGTPAMPLPLAGRHSSNRIRGHQRRVGIGVVWCRYECFPRNAPLFYGFIGDFRVVAGVLVSKN